MIKQLDPVVTWWRNLSARERLTLGGAGILVAILIFGGLVWLPIHRNLDQYRATLPKMHAQLQWMRGQVTRVQQLRTSNPAVAQSGGALGFVEQAAQAFNIQQYLKRLEPEGSNGVRITAEGIAFNDFVSWLLHLQKQGGLRVDSASFEPQPVAGVVNARVLLRAIGS
jgi:general secretion pathway protein M